MQVKDAFTTTIPLDDILKRMAELYPGQDRNAEGYKLAFAEIIGYCTKEPPQELPKGEINITSELLSKQYVLEPDEEDMLIFDISLLKDDTIYGIEFTPWDEVVNLTISEDTVKHLPVLDIVSHLLYELTFTGYSNSEVQQTAEEMANKAQEVIAGIRKMEDQK